MRITIVTTGGTIAKTYNERDGSMQNRRPVIEALVQTLRLVDVDVSYVHLLNKDSVELVAADRERIAAAVTDAMARADAVVVVHGTDTLAETGELLVASIVSPGGPIVLTGAMKPYELRDSDATQNVTEALLACRLAKPGVYVAMHNRVLRFPGVVKDREQMTFRHAALG
jgi:L-asparaginase